MAQAFHIRLRKKLSNILDSIFVKLMPVNLSPDPINLDKIQKILVVRINYRIGNILFTTPLLNALEKQFPHAQIDMMIGAPFISPLIEGMPQINKVYSFPRDLLKHPLKILRLKKELKRNQYDLLITPSLLSTSDSLFSFFVRAKYKVGFYAEDVFAPLTHTVPFPNDIDHEALKPLALMPLFNAEDMNHFAHHMDIRLSEEEKNADYVDIPKHSIGIFRDARNEKKIDNLCWIELITALNTLDNSFHFIDILDPHNKIPLHEDMNTVSEKNLRILASKIAHLDAFICGDTGPMHLASASCTPTIALFKTTSPKLYGTLGEKDLSLVMKTKSIETIAKEIFTHLTKIREA